MLVALKLLLAGGFVFVNWGLLSANRKDFPVMFIAVALLAGVGGVYIISSSIKSAVATSWTSSAQPRQRQKTRRRQENWLTSKKDGWLTDALGISKNGSSCNKTSGWRHPDCPPISAEQWRENNKAKFRADLQEQQAREQELSWERKTKLRKQARQESRELLVEEFQITSWAGGWGRVKISDVNITVAHYPRGGRADVVTVSFEKITKVKRQGNSRGNRIFNKSWFYIYFQTGRGTNKTRIDFGDDALT